MNAIRRKMEQKSDGNISIAGNSITEIPPLAYYIPNFITDGEESEIIKSINNTPQPKWTQLCNRRLQNWGGIPHQKGMIAEQMPSWLQKYIDKITCLNVFDRKTLPNHVLINEYQAGQGIMGHSDGPLFYPTVTTISCGSHTLLEFTKRLDTNQMDRNVDTEFAFLLEPKSLLILQGELYHNYLHSISQRELDVVSVDKIRNLELCSSKYGDGEILERKTRLSLTIRHVPKTSKLKLKF